RSPDTCWGQKLPRLQQLVNSVPPMEYEAKSGSRALDMATGWGINTSLGTRLAAAALAGMLLAAPTAAQSGADAAGQPTNEAVTIASDVRVGGDDNQTRFVVDLSRRIEIRPFMLADPYRVIIDMPQINFQFPGNAGEHGRGLIKAFRYGL